VLVALSIVLITVWFREGDDGPLRRAKRVVAAAVAPVSAAGELTTRPVRGIFFWVADLGVSRSQLEQLREQNLQLRARVVELEEAGLENARLTALLDVARTEEIEAVGARVIGRPSSTWEGVITINRGSEDGIREGMPVIGPLGLLGQTVEVSARSSKIRLITDQRSGVAAMVQRSRAEGIVRGSVEGRLTLDFLAAETELLPGDVVITSGMGGVYPKGLIIGEISEVPADSPAVLKSARVTPAGDPGALEEVLVLIGGVPEAQIGGGE
jgi:rod shape-determining protein MreC